MFTAERSGPEKRREELKAALERAKEKLKKKEKEESRSALI